MTAAKWQFSMKHRDAVIMISSMSPIKEHCQQTLQESCNTKYPSCWVTMCGTYLRDISQRVSDCISNWPAPFPVYERQRLACIAVLAGCRCMFISLPSITDRGQRSLLPTTVLLMTLAFHFSQAPTSLTYLRWYST